VTSKSQQVIIFWEGIGTYDHILRQRDVTWSRGQIRPAAEEHACRAGKARADASFPRSVAAGARIACDMYGFLKS
jgi:hypothetical protein